MSWPLDILHEDYEWNGHGYPPSLVGNSNELIRRIQQDMLERTIEDAARRSLELVIERYS